jgi:hypothetical protein
MAALRGGNTVSSPQAGKGIVRDNGYVKEPHNVSGREALFGHNRPLFLIGGKYHVPPKRRHQPKELYGIITLNTTMLIVNTERT